MARACPGHYLGRTAKEISEVDRTPLATVKITGPPQPSRTDSVTWKTAARVPLTASRPSWGLNTTGLRKTTSSARSAIAA